MPKSYWLQWDLYMSKPASRTMAGNSRATQNSILLSGWSCIHPLLCAEHFQIVKRKDILWKWTTFSTSCLKFSMWSSTVKIITHITTFVFFRFLSNEHIYAIESQEMGCKLVFPIQVAEKTSNGLCLRYAILIHLLIMSTFWTFCTVCFLLYYVQLRHLRSS